jgi:hypothetical protein
MLRTRWTFRAAFGLVAAASVAQAAAKDPLASHDLEGTWTLGSYTSFERPRSLKSLVLTPAEAEAYESPLRALHGMAASKPGELGQAESEFNERGDALARVKGEIRSSWIIDPADGRVPFTKEARRRLALDIPPDKVRLDNPEDNTAAARCIASWSAGAPMIGAPDTNLFELVQTSSAIAILAEKNHDVRIIHMETSAGPVGPSPGPLGYSAGRWDGDTLVVETSNFPNRELVREHDLAVTGSTKVVERFTRTGPDELLYEFKVEDPTLYTQAWRGEMTLHPAKGMLYEYACHEGNYALPSMLRAARQRDKDPAAVAPANRAEPVAATAASPPHLKP